MLTLLLTWCAKAWIWFKAHWQWVVFPVGLLLLFWRLRPRPSVVAPELLGAADEKNKVDEAAAEKVRQASEVRQQELLEIEKEHAVAIKELNEEQRVAVDKLKDDPQALNEFLLDVGKKVRQ